MTDDRPTWTYWYLSFVDTDAPYTVEGDYPGGPRWLGGVYLQHSGDFMSAVEKSWALGCNPGGQVSGLGPLELPYVIPPRYVGRLLSAAELDEWSPPDE